MIEIWYWCDIVGFVSGSAVNRGFDFWGPKLAKKGGKGL